tara:strand:+ start:58 stop:261 length:204 start_codon:yes stop_codon:yes gene_type:complete
MMDKLRIVKANDGVSDWMLVDGDVIIFFDIVEFENITTKLRLVNGGFVAMLLLGRTEEFKALWEAIQ